MKKLELNLDALQVETFETLEGAGSLGTVNAYDLTEGECTPGSGCDSNDACCWAGTHGGSHCETTGAQIICGCSGGALTVCDATCPGYHAAEQFSCGC
ncbi:MAG TPA: hypothetical protein VHG91_09105 [Longimicrobium sp.]|nr:hypothetical protein [Longimicrobium sp.]